MKNNIPDKNIKENANKELEKFEKEAKENLAGWQRAKADFLNYKKNQEKRLTEARQSANERIISRILTILDGFQLAEQHIPENLRRNQWVHGVFFIKDKLLHILNDMGLDEIKSVGEKFNPLYHEAVEEVESVKKSGVVVEEVQKGFMLQDKIIRPAKVKIAK